MDLIRGFFVLVFGSDIFDFGTKFAKGYLGI
jgi:hypothetical protein